MRSCGFALLLMHIHPICGIRRSSARWQRTSKRCRENVPLARQVSCLFTRQSVCFINWHGCRSSCSLFLGTQWSRCSTRSRESDDKNIIGNAWSRGCRPWHVRATSHGSRVTLHPIATPLALRLYSVHMHWPSVRDARALSKSCSVHTASWP